MLVVHEDVLGATRVPQGCSRYQRMLWVPGDDLGYHEIPWAPGDAPDPRRTPCAGGHRRKPERAQMPPPCPSGTAGITTSTSADVSKQLISSDRATALSLLGPRGGRGLVTKGPLLPSTHHPGAWCCRGVQRPFRRGRSVPLGAPLACGARGCGQAGVLIRHIGFAGRESINGGREPERCWRLIRLRRAAAPPGRNQSRLVSQINK